MLFQNRIRSSAGAKSAAASAEFSCGGKAASRRRRRFAAASGCSETNPNEATEIAGGDVKTRFGAFAARAPARNEPNGRGHGGRRESRPLPRRREQPLQPVIACGHALLQCRV